MSHALHWLWHLLLQGVTVGYIRMQLPAQHQAHPPHHSSCQVQSPHTRHSPSRCRTPSCPLPCCSQHQALVPGQDRGLALQPRRSWASCTCRTAWAGTWPAPVRGWAVTAVWGRPASVRSCMRAALLPSRHQPAPRTDLDTCAVMSPVHCWPLHTHLIVAAGRPKAALTPEAARLLAACLLVHRHAATGSRLGPRAGPCSAAEAQLRGGHMSAGLQQISAGLQRWTAAKQRWTAANQQAAKTAPTLRQCGSQAPQQDDELKGHCVRLREALRRTNERVPQQP